LLGRISQKVKSVNNQRVDLSPGSFQQDQQLTGRDFTKFVNSKGVLHSSDFHSLDKMSFQDLAGHHSWLNAVRSELRSSLLHYQDCKRRAPSTTSACIQVPRRRHGSVGTMLHRWTVVMEIPTDQLVRWCDVPCQTDAVTCLLQRNQSNATRNSALGSRVAGQ
jgi:hypothetical protein